MNTTNKRVTTSSQRQQYDLMGVGNKGDCFVFDLFKNRVSQLEKEISKKDEIISFLTEQILVKNAFTTLGKTKVQKEEVRTTILSMTVLNLRYLGRKRIQLN